jgi:hypothetical protein
MQVKGYQKIRISTYFFKQCHYILLLKIIKP